MARVIYIPPRSDATFPVTGSMTALKANQTNLNTAGGAAVTWVVPPERIDTNIFQFVGTDVIQVLMAGVYTISGQMYLTGAGQRTNLLFSLQTQEPSNPWINRQTFGASGYIRGANGHEESSVHFSAFTIDLVQNHLIRFVSSQLAQAGQVDSSLGHITIKREGDV